MPKKLTITLDEAVYDGLHRVIGRRRISRFIEELVRPHILAHELEAAYQQMAQNETREAEGSPGPKPQSVMSAMNRGEVWWVNLIRRLVAKFVNSVQPLFSAMTAPISI